MSKTNSQNKNTNPENLDEQVVNPVTQTLDNNSELNELKLSLAAATAKNLSLMADFENFRRRSEQEKATYVAMGNSMLISDLAQVYDDLQLALNDESLTLDTAKQAIYTAQSKITSSLQVAGVTRINVAKGEDFNPGTMEAIANLKVEGMEGKVIDVISGGLKYANKEGLIKSAKVVVGSK